MKLRSLGVPSLSTLIVRLEEIEEYEFFVDLVKEFLPERERGILHESTPTAQIAAFASFFEDRYFPLDDSFKLGDVEGYSDLVRGIPINPLGLSYDDYQSIASDWRGGFQLITYLIESPFNERAALAEACEEYLPRDLIERIPQGGLSLDEAHQLFDDTPHKALALWADIIWHHTGNFFLDIDYEELWNEGLPQWDRGTVEHLTTEWQQAERIHEEIVELAEWLEENPTARFRELLNIILEGRSKWRSQHNG